MLNELGEDGAESTIGGEAAVGIHAQLTDRLVSRAKARNEP